MGTFPLSRRESWISFSCIGLTIVLVALALIVSAWFAYGIFLLIVPQAIVFRHNLRELEILKADHLTFVELNRQD